MAGAQEKRPGKVDHSSGKGNQNTSEPPAKWIRPLSIRKEWVARAGESGKTGDTCQGNDGREPQDECLTNSMRATSVVSKRINKEAGMAISFTFSLPP
ncbi:hypothetical protein HNY73_012868 [Argiope bruennichi]|uniref:Uncharacterized protein n=1 Tax=Argiope bruennichi TaxID=94029 RepID=A0A8T0EY43_ARGBR|nr:hypothetical protein HNY73_012868 [Argiope bruennichi]